MTPDWSDRVKIVEVGPRDGLQNEPTPIATDVKLRFIAALIDAGCHDIEVTSFVHPGRVPQLADAAEVMAGLANRPDVVCSALVPNRRGLERALACGVQRIAVFTAASETFTRKNIGMTIDESFETFTAIIREARAVGVSVRGYVSTAFACPYEGRVDRIKVADVTQRLLALGVDEVSISDTIGVACPSDVFDTVGFLCDRVGRNALALHFHDTCGTALTNVLAGLQLGITTFDASTGGLGGCPFAPGASGNLATEDLVYMLDGMGIETGIELRGLLAAGRVIESVLGRPLSSHQQQRARCDASGSC